jgi:sphingolipid delta-4 desaturase
MNTTTNYRTGLGGPGEPQVGLGQILPDAAKGRKRDGTDMEFIEVDFPEPHRARARHILKTHPEVRELFGRNVWTAPITVAIVAAQVAVGWAVSSQPWYIMVAAAWLFGAFANHAMFVVIHECSHNLVFQNKKLNQLMGMVANLPLVVPSSESFRLYHLKHHQYQGDYDLDADLAGRWEAKLIGNSFAGKLFWELLYPIFQSVRVHRFAKSGRISFVTPGVIANIAVQFAFDVAIYMLFGPMALLYMLVSLFFSIGAHPLGARWIQEHFIIPEGKGQETYSYYGPLNVPALNVGYHNEHHDFPFIAWHNLPKLKALAPEMYDTLYSHTSWTKLWLRFLFDRRLSLYSRVTRDGQINRRRATLPKGTYAPETFDETAEGAAS